MMLKEIYHIAVPTAFFKDESLHTQGTMEHIRNLYNQGVKSVLVSGTTGEQHSLSLEEKINIINELEMEEELLNNMEVIFGVSSTRQAEAEELAKKIRHTNISGVLLGYPPYIQPTQEEAIIYTNSIVELSKKPTILYNNPARTGFDLSVDSIIQLSKNELIVGIKEAGEKEKVSYVKKDMKRNDFYFYAGGEVDLEKNVSLGFNRLSSIAGNVYPNEVRAWFHTLLMNQTISHSENLKIESIMEQVYQGTPLVNVKKIINQQGIQIGNCRSPIGNE